MAATNVTANGAVIEGRDITGQVRINASNVTIRNCRIRNGGWWTVWVQGGSLTLEDCEIEGTDGGTAAVLADGGPVHILRCNIWGAEDGLRLGVNGCTVRDSYLHTFRGDVDSHYDGINVDGTTGWEITGNTILLEHGQTGCVWIGDPRYGPSAGLLEGNLLGGGGYSIYAGHSTAPGLRVLDNHFTTAFYPDAGANGPVAYWESPGNTWSGNVWHDGPSAGNPVNP